MQKRPDHVALYGNVALVRAHCEKCQGFAFILGGKFACCDSPYHGTPVAYERVSQPEFRRRLPSAAARKEILADQDNRCFYCSRQFGSCVWVGGKKVPLKLHWDHMVPHSYSQNNRAENFVAACHRCNTWKGSMVFQTLEDAQVYLLGKWGEDVDD